MYTIYSWYAKKLCNLCHLTKPILSQNDCQKGSTNTLHSVKKYFTDVIKVSRNKYLLRDVWKHIHIFVSVTVTNVVCFCSLFFYLKRASRTHSAHTSRILQKRAAESLAPRWIPDTTGSPTGNEPDPDIRCCHTVQTHTQTYIRNYLKTDVDQKKRIKSGEGVLPDWWAGTPGNGPHTNCTLGSWGTSFHLELQRKPCPDRQKSKSTHMQIY